MEKIEAVRYPAEWESSLAVSIRSSKDEAMEAELEDTARWKVYSDGSGIDSMICASAVLYRDGQEVRVSWLQLGPDTAHTVYEGEGVGISLALGLLWTEQDIDGDVTIAVDSQAAIRATANPHPHPLALHLGRNPPVCSHRAEKAPPHAHHHPLDAGSPRRPRE